MATFQELMRAADNADRAGDAAAARELVQEAMRVQGAQPVVRVDEAGRAFEQIPTDTPYRPGMSPPRADENFIRVYEPSAYEPTPKRNRFGDTAAEASEDSRAMLSTFARGLGNPMESVTRGALPEGLPEGIKRPAAFMGDLGGATLSTAATLLSGGAGLVGDIVGTTPTKERQLARDLIAASQVAVPELAGVSSTTRLAGRAGQAAMDAPEARTPTQASARAAEELNITPSLGAIGKGPAMTAATLEKIPGAGGIIARDAERFVSEIEGAFKRIVTREADPQSVMTAGETLQSSLVKFRDKFKAQASEFYAKVGEHIPAGTRVEVTNARQAVQDAKAAFAENPALAQRLGLNDWDAILNEAAENGMSWQGLQSFRSQIGEAIGRQKGALADQSDAQLRTLYGALTADMFDAANAAGGDAVKALQRANTYYRAGAQRIEKMLDRTISADSPERAFSIFTAMTKEGRSSSDVKRLLAIRRSMPAEEWNEVASTVVDRLGRARPGQQSAEGGDFSASTFLTEWNKLSPEAKNTLLPKRQVKDLNTLGRVIEGARGANAERNVSNTGTVATAALAGAGATQAPLTVISVLAGANVGARFLTSERALRAMNNLARGDARQMRAIANSNSPFAMDAQEIMRLYAAQTAGGEPANADIPPAITIAN